MSKYWALYSNSDHLNCTQCLYSVALQLNSWLKPTNRLNKFFYIICRNFIFFMKVCWTFSKHQKPILQNTNYVFCSHMKGSCTLQMDHADSQFWLAQKEVNFFISKILATKVFFFCFFCFFSFFARYIAL